MHICIYQRLDRQAAKSGSDFPHKAFFFFFLKELLTENGSTERYYIWNRNRPPSPLPCSNKGLGMSSCLVQAKTTARSTPCLSLSQCTCTAHVTLESKRKRTSLPHQPAKRAVSGIQCHVLCIVPLWALFWGQEKANKQLSYFICEAAESLYPSYMTAPRKDV